jgi:hypothetical protein
VGGHHLRCPHLGKSLRLGGSVAAVPEYPPCRRLRRSTYLGVVTDATASRLPAESPTHLPVSAPAQHHSSRDWRAVWSVGLTALKQPLGRSVVKVEAAVAMGFACAGSKDRCAARFLVPDRRPQPERPAISATASGYRGVRPTLYLAQQSLDVAEMVSRLGLRAAAKQFGVSHEAIRQSLRAHGVATNLASRHAERDQRVRELAAQGVPRARIAEEVGLSTWRVRALCADLPRRGEGRPKRVIT